MERLRRIRGFDRGWWYGGPVAAQVPFDPGIQFARRRHGGTVEKPHHPRVRPELREDVVQNQLIFRGLRRRCLKTVGIGQHELDRFCEKKLADVGNIQNGQLEDRDLKPGTFRRNTAQEADTEEECEST